MIIPISVSWIHIWVELGDKNYYFTRQDSKDQKHPTKTTISLTIVSTRETLKNGLLPGCELLLEIFSDLRLAID